MPTIAQQLKEKLGVDGSNITEILNNAGGHGANIAEAIKDVEGGGGSSDRDLMQYLYLTTVRHFDAAESASIVVPEGIREIGDYAFAGIRGNIDKIVIPSTVTKLGESILYEASFKNGIVVDCYAPASLNVGDNADGIWDDRLTFRWHINASEFYTYVKRATPEDGATIEPRIIDGLYMPSGSSLIFNDRQYEISGGESH